MVRWLEANGYNVSYSTRRGHRPAGRRGLPQHRYSCPSVTTSTGRPGSGPTSRRPANAGVHLAFFSGNEIFWKTRWENSIDGSGTPYRTLVSYKETHANARSSTRPIPPTWTGTWRDPRFSPPADGGRPENALTGKLFMVNDSANVVIAISVPEAEGKLRFWRNTSVAKLAGRRDGDPRHGTLGYEWDEDVDNGVRPPGLFQLSVDDHRRGAEACFKTTARPTGRGPPRTA